MKGKLFVQDVFVYGLNSFLIKLFAFVMIPIIVRLFSVTEFGVIEVMLSVAGFLALFYGLGYDVVMKKSVLIDKEKYKIEDQLKTNFIFILFWGGVLSLLLILFSKYISIFIFGSTKFIKVFIWGVMSCYLNALIGVFLTLTRVEFKRIKFLKINVLKVFFEYLLIILLLLFLESKAHYYFMAMVLVDIIILFILLFIFNNKLKGSFKINIIKNIYALGIPVMISGIGYWVFNMSDKIILSHVTGDTYYTGIYSMVIKMLSIYTFIMQSYQLALVPRAFQMYGEDPINFKKMIEKIQVYSLAVFSLIALTNFAGLKLMLSLFATKEYMVGLSIVYPLILAYIIYPLTSIASIGIYVSDKIQKLAPVVWLAAFINIVVNYMLIKNIGMLAASISTLMAYAFIYIVYWMISCKELKWKPNFSKITINFILIVITIMVVHFINITNIYFDLVVKLIIVLFYVLILFIFKIIELKEFTNMIKTIFIKSKEIEN